MAADLWLSLAIGGGMGLLYGLVSHLSTRRALRHRGRSFLAWYFGGMIARMAAGLVVLILVLRLVPVHRLAFIGSFLGLVFIGIIFEVVTLQRSSISEDE